MTDRRTFLASGIVALGAGLAGCAGGGLSGGWVTLLDGSTSNLDGWTQIGQGNWSFVDGALQGKDGKAGFLVSKDAYADFEIRAEFWADEDANSGIFIRCQDRNKVGADSAYEVNIWDKRPDQRYATGGIVDYGAVSQPAPKAANRWNTLILLGILTAIAVLLGYLAGAVLDGGDWRVVSGVGVAGALALGAVSIIWSMISLAFGARMVLSMADAKEITKADAPQLYNIVEEMTLASGLPMPKVLVMETDALNAFATGTTPSNAAIAVTRGLLDTLSRDELQGVVGHEMSHIANLDTRYMTVVGVTVGLIALVADMIMRSLQWGSFRNRDSDKKSSGSGFLIIILVVVAVLAPIAARAVQMAVSRQREYLADATSVQFTRNPNGLISALAKLEAAAKPFPGVSNATQHLFIVNPMQRLTEKTTALMATHPEIGDRIARLRNLG